MQDGDENIFYFSHNKPPFWFFSLATMFWLLYSIIELQNIKKWEHFIKRLFYNKILKLFEKYHLSYKIIPPFWIFKKKVFPFHFYPKYKKTIVKWTKIWFLKIFIWKTIKTNTVRSAIFKKSKTLLNSRF
jgi:hypothetical protein